MAFQQSLVISTGSKLIKIITEWGCGIHGDWSNSDRESERARERDDLNC